MREYSQPFNHLTIYEKSKGAISIFGCLQATT